MHEGPFYAEACALGFLLVYMVNFFIGRKANTNIAEVRAHPSRPLHLHSTDTGLSLHGVTRSEQSSVNFRCRAL